MRFVLFSLLSVLPLVGCGSGNAAEDSKTSAPATAPAAAAAPAPAATPQAPAPSPKVAAKVDPVEEDDLAAHRKMVEAAKREADDEGARKREFLEAQRTSPVTAAPVPTGMPRSAPRLFLRDKEKDFGSMLDGEVSTHDFAFENAGDAPLTISRVQPSCGCTVSEVKIGDLRYEYGRSIPSGTQGTIGVRLDTHNQHGALAKTVVVYSDDPAGPITLRIQAQVEQFFVFDPQPPTLNFETVFLGETRTKILTVRTDRVEAFHITEPAPLPKGLAVSWEPLEAGKENAWKISATIGEGPNEGTFTHRVTLKTDADRTIDFYVTASISGPIQILPNAYILFGLIQRGTKTSRSVELSVREGEPPLEITGTVLDVTERGGTAPKDLREYFTVNVRPVEEGKRYVVEVVALDTLPPGVFGGTLHIQTNHPAVPQRDIVLSGFIR